MGRRIQLDKYTIGRTMAKRMRKAIALAVFGRLAAMERFVRGLRLVRWMARQRLLRVVVGLLALVAGLFGKYVWRPGKRYVRLVRRYLGRREVWIHLIVWGICGLTGLVLARSWDTLDPAYLRLLGALITVMAFTLISLSSPLTGLFIWLSTSPMLSALIHFKFAEGMPLFTSDSTCLVILGAAYMFQRKNLVRQQSARLLHVCMGLFIVGELIAAYRTEELFKQSTMQAIEQYLTPMIIYVFARRWITTRKQLAQFFLVVLIVGSYFVGFAIPEHFTGVNYFSRTGRAAYVDEELGTVRAQGPASAPQEFGLILTLVATVAVVWYSFEPSKAKRAVLMLIMIAAFVGIANTLRRSVYVGAILAMFWLLAGSVKVRRTTGMAIFATAVALVAIWVAFSQTAVFEDRIKSPETLYQRAVIQATAVNIIKHNPILGIGFDKYGEGNRKYLVPYKNLSASYGEGFGSPHSSYLRILVDGGIVAFLPFAGMIVMIFVTSYRIYKRAIGDGLLGRDGVVVFVGFALGVLVQASSTDSFFYQKYLISMLFFCFGALSGVHLRVDRPADELEPEQARGQKRFAMRPARHLSPSKRKAI